MAKRFTDSTKWSKPFIRTMKAPYKLLWMYILDECDHAGIWQVDLEVAQLKIGERLKLDEAVKFFEGKIFVFSGGEKWFIPDFIEFQYGSLNPKNRLHESVIRILEKNNLAPYEDLIRTLQGPKDKDKEKDKDKNKEKEKDKGEAEEKEPSLPEFVDPNFSDSYLTWMAYKKDRHESYKNDKSEQMFYEKLLKLSNKDPVLAMEIVKESMANNYAGIFPIKNKGNGTKTHITTAPAGNTDFSERF